MKTFFKEKKLLTTVLAIFLTFTPIIVYFLFFRESFIADIIQDLPLPNPISGGILGIILGSPGLAFGAYFQAYGFKIGSKN